MADKVGALGAEERNGEGTLTKVMMVVGVVVSTLVTLVAALIDTPLVDQWPWLGAVAAVLAVIAQMVGKYSIGRSMIKVEQEKTKAALVVAGKLPA